MFLIGTIANEPDLFPCAVSDFTIRPDCKRPGIFAEILSVILTDLQAHYQLVPYSKEHYNNTDIWSLMYNQVKTTAIDTMASDWTMTSSRTEELTFSFPTREVTPVFIVAKQAPNLLSGSLLAFSVFSWQLWLTLFCFLFLLSFIILVFRLRNAEQKSISFNFWPFVRYIIHQHERFHPESTRSGNMLLILLGLLSVLFSSLYQGCLLAKLLYPKTVAPFKDPFEMINLVKSKKLTMVTFSDVGWHAQEMKHSSRNYFHLLRDATSQNPVVHEASSEKIAEMVRTGSYVHATTSNYISKFLQDCNVTVVYKDASLPAYWRGLIFPKDSPWASLISEKLVKFQDFTEKIIKKYTEDVKCENKITKVKEPLTFLSLSGVFALFVGLTSLGLAAFLIERFAWYHRKNVQHEEVFENDFIEAEQCFNKLNFCFNKHGLMESAQCLEKFRLLVADEKKFCMRFIK